jgi:methyltransferase (TIGR00027 family)
VSVSGGGPAYTVLLIERFLSRLVHGSRFFPRGRRRRLQYPASPMQANNLNSIFMNMENPPDDIGAVPDPVPKPSALKVAILRAAHQLLDTPLVFEDALALRILGTVEEEALRCNPSQYNTARLKGMRASLVVRSKLAEEQWARSQSHGVRQYVILGAGLDTFAYRNKDHDRSRIFEVDLPAMQQWKRECLRVAGIEEPESLTFVPVDFERSTLAEGLGQVAFRDSEPAFFSWLGVTMYLEEDAVMSTLCFIASLAPGSGVVFDYGVLPKLLSPKERASVELLAARAAEHGELWKTYFAPSVLVQTLRSFGFNEVEDFGPQHLNEQYFSGRLDGFRKSGVSRLICARI